MDQNNIMNLENALINFIQNELGIINMTNEEETPIKRVKEDYLNSLEVLTDVDDQICNICFDTIKKGDECIKLPCEGGSHYFHKNNNDECEDNKMVKKIIHAHVVEVNFHMMNIE